jgi:hypothetical protein
VRRYVHLGVNPYGATAGMDSPSLPVNFFSRLERFLTQHADWYRYASQNYVLYTDDDLTQLAEAIKALPGFENVYLLFTEITDTSFQGCQGIMVPKFWRWIHGERVNT